jgi:uncharacterized membrane protein
MTNPRPTPEQLAVVTEGGDNIERIFGIAAGVFGFSLTLLASTMVIPDIAGELTDAGLEQISGSLTRSVIDYIQTFIMTAILWMGFHRSFKFIRRYDGTLHWLVVLLLLQVALIPFLSQLSDRYDGGKTTGIFFFVFFLIGLFDNLIWFYATHKHRLVDPGLDPSLIRYIALQTLIPDILFLVCSIVSFLDSDGMAGLVFTASLILVAIFGKTYHRILIRMVW